MPVVSGAPRRTEGQEKCYRARFPWASPDMETTRRPPSPPSHDSLSSSDSFLFSDSDPIEDDTDVFLSEGDAVRPDPHMPSSSSPRSSLHGDALSSPGSQWACDGFARQEQSVLVARRQSTPLSSSISSSSTSGAWSASESEGASEKDSPSQGDLLFAQKCLELQCFVKPLLVLLHGLKNGRFDKGLSSFQQSVAMDRIQRIVGVLQKPSSGEKYLNTLLQVEMMLKLWFPQVSPQASTVLQTTSSTSQADPCSGSCSGPGPANNSSTPPHKHKDQLHMPVKKRRLSWSDTDSSCTSPPIFSKRFLVKGEQGHSLDRESSSLQAQTAANATNSQRVLDGYLEPTNDTPTPPVPSWSEPSLTWVHVAPILSPPKSCASGAAVGAGTGTGASAGPKGSHMVTVAPPLSSRGSPAMQDSSVSSTTLLSQPPSPLLQPTVGGPSPAIPLHTHPEPAHDSALQGRGQATTPPITPRPLSRVEPGKRPSPMQS